MRLLLLGGTRFLGRHTVEAALARGHEVTVFTRGRTPLPWPGRVTALTGDRDPRHGNALAQLATRRYDAVVDTSGYVPRVVDATASLLEPGVGRYLFVSSLSAYASPTPPGTDESGALATLADPATEDVLPNYGGLKAACEEVVRRRFGHRALLVRPGLIVGPFDATDRFGYWVARFRLPGQMGDRAARAVVPGPPSRPVQFIDARDLAAWMVAALERGLDGAFNACSPAGQWTMGDVVAACREGEPRAPEAAYVDDATLLSQGVQPWTGLPLWIPASDADAEGFFAFDCRKAQARGLAVRPLAATVADTAAWLSARDPAGAWAHVLDAAGERAVLAAASA